MGSPIGGIEQVTNCKLLGVIVQDTFSVDMHVIIFCRSVASAYFWLKRLRD